MGKARAPRRTGREGRLSGRAGQLLDKMIGVLDLKREDVYIANIVKCRPPPKPATPRPGRAGMLPAVFKSTGCVYKSPKIIVCLGRIAAKKTDRREPFHYAGKGKHGWRKKGFTSCPRTIPPRCCATPPKRRKLTGTC